MKVIIMRLHALVWKCFLMRKRNWSLSLVELLSLIFTAYCVHCTLSETILSESQLFHENGLSLYYVQFSPLIRLCNSTYSSYIAYTPSNNVTDAIMRRLYKVHRMLTLPVAKANETELEHWFTYQGPYKEMESIGIVFLITDIVNKIFNYTIRTDYPYMTARHLCDARPQMYEQSDFVKVQLDIDDAILHLVGYNMDDDQLMSRELDISETGPVMLLIYLFLAISNFVFTVCVGRVLLQETCSGVKNVMKTLGGVSCTWFWIHWLLYSIILQLPFSVVFAIVLSQFAPPFQLAHLFTVWFLLVLYMVNCTVLLFVATCLFNDSTIGLAACSFTWCVIHVFGLLGLNCSFHWVLCICFYFIPLHNLIGAIYSISSFHGTWTISDIFSRGFIEPQKPVAYSLIMFTIEIIILSFCLLLFDPETRVFSRWTGMTNTNEILSHPKIGSRFEDPPKGMKPVIEIRGVTKIYGGSVRRTAVVNVDLVVYKGETLALLGHRDAGKSTILALVLGITLPSRGQILVDGKELSRGNSINPKHFGYCTQQNYQIVGLTVMEHLVFFGMLKGLSGFEAVLRGSYLMSLLKISDIRNQMLSALSVEARKKLSFAISLIEDPKGKVLILDEPTARMSNESAQQIWEALMEIKQNCTILIATQNMEEAIVLADRIAIFDHGEVVSLGSTAFLKNHINIGYHLKVFTKSNLRHKEIQYLVQTHANNLKVEIVSPTQVNFIIKEEALEKFPTLFEALERYVRDLEITGISVKCKGLEDIFMITNESFVDEIVDFEPRFDQTESSVDYIKLNGCYLLYQQFKTLMLKRMRRSCRKSKLILLLIIVETITLLTLINSVYSDFHTQKSILVGPLPITLDICGKSNNIISFDHESDQSIARTAADLIQQQKGDVFVFHSGDTYFKMKKGFTYFPLVNLSFAGDNITIIYNGVHHMTAISASIITNTLLKNFTNSSTPHIQVINHPVGESNQCRMSRGYFKFFVNGWLHNLLIGVILSIMLFPFMRYLIEERASGFKLQQLIAGVSPLLYVLTNFLFDLVLFIWILVTYYIIIDVTNLIFLEDIGSLHVLLLIIIFYAPSGILFAYLSSYFIDSAVFGSFVFLTLNLIAVLFFIMWTRVLKDIMSIKTFLSFSSLFSINPLFAAMMCIFELFETYVDDFMCLYCQDKDSCKAVLLPILDIPSGHNRSAIAVHLLILATDWILYLIIIIIIEYKLCRKLNPFFRKRSQQTDQDRGMTDEDVQKEVEKVKSVVKYGDTNIPLKVNDLVKMRSLAGVSVHKVSFMVSEGECFGLLGPERAGKSEVLQILAGEVSLTSGDAIIKKYSLVTQRRKFQKQLGYCPHKDALVDLFTGEEILEMICLLRGVPQQNVRNTVNKYLDLLGMTHCAKYRIAEYTNGLKRKLSTALAFIGDPVVVLLDQPTSGIDPESRKRVWRLVESHRNAGQAIVLATDSTEECDALCTRQALMEHGMIKCIGNSEYLKNKFVQGFTVLVKLKYITGTKTDLLKEEFALIFPSSELISIHKNLMQYQIDDDGVLLSELFSELIRLRSKHAFIDYFTVSNTTLTQVMLSPGQMCIQLRSRSSRLSALQSILYRLTPL